MTLCSTRKGCSMRIVIAPASCNVGKALWFALLWRLLLVDGIGSSCAICGALVHSVRPVWLDQIRGAKDRENAMGRKRG
jgi:hypothetical protein